MYSEEKIKRPKNIKIFHNGQDITSKVSWKWTGTAISIDVTDLSWGDLSVSYDEPDLPEIKQSPLEGWKEKIEHEAFLYWGSLPARQEDQQQGFIDGAEWALENITPLQQAPLPVRECYVAIPIKELPDKEGDYIIIFQGDESEFSATCLFQNGKFYAYESEGITYDEPEDTENIIYWLKKVTLPATEDWEGLKEKFFKECTDDTGMTLVHDGSLVREFTGQYEDPVDTFEWFKNNLGPEASNSI